MSLGARLLRLVTPGRVLIGGLALLAVFAALWVLPSRDYIFLPDIAHPVAPLVHVSGGHEPHNGGAIYFVDVLIRKATLLEELLGGPESGSSLYPADDVVPAGITAAQNNTVGLSEMLSSQQIAAAVALRADGRKVTTPDNGVLIYAIMPGYPASNRLEPYDVVVGIDGVPLRTTEQFSSALHRVRVGAPITLTVLRDGSHVRVRLRTTANPKDRKQPFLGVYIEQNQTVDLPVKISIDSGQIGGPSAGLAFALEVLQQLGRNVDHGLRIAATGQLTLGGQVQPIGGIEQKTIGAREAHVDAFLVPAGQNATDAEKYAHGLRIIPVYSFQQALHALATFARER
jgi:PDZ domain-containing protein